jgi:hypothetical protein
MSFQKSINRIHNLVKFLAKYDFSVYVLLNNNHKTIIKDWNELVGCYGIYPTELLKINFELRLDINAHQTKYKYNDVYRKEINQICKLISIVNRNSTYEYIYKMFEKYINNFDNINPFYVAGYSEYNTFIDVSDKLNTGMLKKLIRKEKLKLINRKISLYLSET